MRLEQITYFLRVAEHGNITAAAKSLYISQPALSKQITLLEQEIGLPLFERQARGGGADTGWYAVSEGFAEYFKRIGKCQEKCGTGRSRTETVAKYGLF